MEFPNFHYLHIFIWNRIIRYVENEKRNMLRPPWKRILLFGRIQMKEHSFFLQAAFPAGETGYRNKADWFRKQFESMLAQTVVLSDGMVRADVLQSEGKYLLNLQRMQKSRAI